VAIEQKSAMLEEGLKDAARKAGVKTRFYRQAACSAPTSAMLMSWIIPRRKKLIPGSFLVLFRDA